MGANVLDMGCTIKCPHGGAVTVIPGNVIFKAGGNFMLLSTDVMTIAGCTFTLPNNQPSPCTTIEWKNEAKKVKINSTPVLLETSLGICKNAQNAPQGTAIITGVQKKVKGL